MNSVKELTLGANQWIENKRRLKWNPEINEISSNGIFDSSTLRVSEDSMIVRLKPMEIKTFVIDLSHSSRYQE